MREGASFGIEFQNSTTVDENATYVWCFKDLPDESDESDEPDESDESDESD